MDRDTIERIVAATVESAVARAGGYPELADEARATLVEKFETERTPLEVGRDE